MEGGDRNDRGRRDSRGSHDERGRDDRDRRNDRGERFRSVDDRERPSRRDRSDDSGDRRKSNADIEFSRFFIDKGSKDDLNPASLIGLINKYSNERGIEIGKIEIMKSFSFFEIDKKFERKLAESFQGAVFDNAPVMLEAANSKGGGFREEGERKKKKKSFENRNADTPRSSVKRKKSDPKPYDKGKRRTRKP
jgi:ATP-dependent RNA helicase DeaD